MRPIAELFEQCAALDIKLGVREGRLRVNAPGEALTAELRSELAARKDELLEFMLRPAAGASPRPQRQSALESPLSFGQERLWSLVRIDPNSSRYNVPLAFEIEGALNVRVLERSLDAIQQRHAILRTAFQGEELGTARQGVAPPSAFVLPYTDLFLDLLHLDREQAASQLKELVEAEIRRPFDISHAPLWRAHLYRLDKKRHLLALAMHHLIFDGVSQSVFLHELGECYRAFALGVAPELALPAFEYADFAAWQRLHLDRERLERQRAYWAGRLSGEVPPLAVPNDRPRTASGGRAGIRHFRLPAALARRLLEAGRIHHASPHVLLMAAYASALNGFTGQEDLLICSPTSGRDHADLEQMIGYFNGLVVLRLDLSGDPAFDELIRRVRQAAVEALDNQGIPLQEIAQLPNLIRTPLTRAMFSFQDAASRGLSLPGMRCEPVSIRKDASDFELAMYVQQSGESLGGVLEFNAGLFAEETITQLIAAFEERVRLIGTQPEARPSSLPVSGKSLSAIEQILVQHPRIEQAKVILNRVDGRRLAYLVLDEDSVPTPEEILSHAAAALPDHLVPASFIPVDRFPLLPDGRVDVDRLPDPLQRGQAQIDHVAPRSELEQQLAAIWKRVLWLDREVGIHDNFRQLGGHSLLSVQLVLEVERALKRPMPVQALSAIDTVATMAAAFAADEDGSPGRQAIASPASGLSADIYQRLRAFTAAWAGRRQTPESVIVGLNTTGTRQKLFWCLQREYELSQLARYLGPEQPVYGMRSGNKVMIKSQENIDRLAEHYVHEILQIQAQGPYLIGGNCQAAKIAFRIATRLKQLGHEISLLFLHEKFVPGPYDGPVVLTFGRDSTRNPYLKFHEPALAWRKHYSGPLCASIVSGAHGEFFQEPNIQDLVGTLQQRMAELRGGDFSTWLPAVPDRALQLLPPEACRARITGPESLLAGPGEALVLSFRVTNLSPCAWQPGSGLFLANRWLSRKGRLHRALDGRTALPAVLEPGETIELDLMVRTPEKQGEWLLEIDLVEQGMAWFGELGSQPLRVAIRIKDERSGIFKFFRRG